MMMPPPTPNSPANTPAAAPKAKYSNRSIITPAIDLAW
jgi:hypothetical protein